MNIFEYDVAVSSHDWLKQGVTIHHWTRITVAAETELEARLIACELGSCGTSLMVTDVMIRL